MKRFFVLNILIFCGIFLVILSADAKKQKPFWESNPSEMQKIINDRKVSVAVKVKDTDDDKQQFMDMQGVGLVSAPVDYTGPWMLDYQNLKRVSGYVRELKWNPATKMLYLHTEAMGYHARMHIKMVETVTPNKSTVVNWKVHKGFLKNLSGNLSMNKQSFGKTLFSIQGIGNFEKTNIPNVFIKFGFEIFIQKFAERVRQLIEEDFSKGAPLKATKGK